jgi:hypothetical protein
MLWLELRFEVVRMSVIVRLMMLARVWVEG